MMADNMKIISLGGGVTLHSPVKPEEEKTVIAAKARAIAGQSMVDDPLEVISSKQETT
jgi:hypothetical protein